MALSLSTNQLSKSVPQFIVSRGLTAQRSRANTFHSPQIPQTQIMNEHDTAYYFKFDDETKQNLDNIIFHNSFKMKKRCRSSCPISLYPRDTLAPIYHHRRGGGSGGGGDGNAAANFTISAPPTTNTNIIISEQPSNQTNISIDNKKLSSRKQRKTMSLTIDQIITSLSSALSQVHHHHSTATTTSTTTTTTTPIPSPSIKSSYSIYQSQSPLITGNNFHQNIISITNNNNNNKTNTFTDFVNSNSNSRSLNYNNPSQVIILSPINFPKTIANINTTNSLDNNKSSTTITTPINNDNESDRLFVDGVIDKRNLNFISFSVIDI